MKGQTKYRQNSPFRRPKKKNFERRAEKKYRENVCERSDKMSPFRRPKKNFERRVEKKYGENVCERSDKMSPFSRPKKNLRDGLKKVQRKCL